MDGIHHLALRVRDCAVAAGFYSSVFGLLEMRRVEDEGRLRAVWFRVGKTVLMLERSLLGKGYEKGSAHVLAFPAQNLDEAEEKLSKLGIPVTGRTPNTLYFQDPDGHRLALSTYSFSETTL